MKLNDKEREGSQVLLDGTAYVAAAAVSALLTLLFPSKKPKKADSQKARKKQNKSFAKKYRLINKAISGGAETAALKWLEEDVKKNPDKYLKRDKGIVLEQAELIDI